MLLNMKNNYVRASKKKTPLIGLALLRIHNILLIAITHTTTATVELQQESPYFLPGLILISILPTITDSFFSSLGWFARERKLKRV